MVGPRLSLSIALALGVLAPRAAPAYEAVTVTDGGTIRGKVVYQGEIPTRKIVPTKDRATCGEVRDEPQVEVGADKGVKGAVVWLKGIEKGKAMTKPANKPEIVNQKCTFVPHVQALPIGSIVVVNMDPVMHNTHAFHGKQTVFNVALPVKGQRIEKPITKPGINRVECDTHGWMLGWIFAAENPYYAVTDEKGTFSIGDVPPGSYTLVAWQEYTGEMELPVTVKPKEAVDVPVTLKKQ
jgi:Polysaccharide lyase family 4, domain II